MDLVYIERDLAALRFVRCVHELPDGLPAAGGAGFSLAEAEAKCESEAAERFFYGRVLKPSGVKVLGIGAHVDGARAVAHALDEATESLCLRQIVDSGEARGMTFEFGRRFSLVMTKVSRGYLTVIRGAVGGELFLVQTVRGSFVSSLLKAWEEYRSVLHFRPQGEELARFTKGNSLLSQVGLKGLRFIRDRRFRYDLSLEAYEIRTAEYHGRQIAYVPDQGQEEKT